jgi:hypothetical protein
LKEKKIPPPTGDGILILNTRNPPPPLKNPEGHRKGTMFAFFTGFPDSYLFLVSASTLPTHFRQVGVR